MPVVTGNPDADLSWTVFGESARGRSHVRKGLPNQDSLEYSANDGVVVLAIADGHGSAKCFRSDRGSRFAVEVAQDALRELAAQPGALREPLSEISALLADGQIARSIYARWNDKVKADLTRDPLASVGEAPLQAPPPAACAGEASPDMAATSATTAVVPPRGAPSAFLPNETREPYGATLLAALLTDTFGLFLQLGDGDMLALTGDGIVERIVEHDPAHIANETKSLCGGNPLADFRTSFQVWAGRPPRLIMLSTDGYSNAFREPHGFEQVAGDMGRILAEPEGELSLRRHLRGWLQGASGFSGDDVTAGLVWRAPKPEDLPYTPPVPPVTPAETPAAVTVQWTRTRIPSDRAEAASTPPSSLTSRRSDSSGARPTGSDLVRPARVVRVMGWAVAVPMAFSVGLSVGWYLGRHGFGPTVPGTLSRTEQQATPRGDAEPTSSGPQAGPTADKHAAPLPAGAPELPPAHREAGAQHGATETPSPDPSPTDDTESREAPVGKGTHGKEGKARE